MVRKPMLSHLAPQAATRFDADIKYCPLFFTFFSVTDSIAHLNDIFHPLTVVLYNFPLCVFGNSVIRTGDIPQFFCHWFEPLDFFVDGGIIKGQEVFAHSADSFHLFSILGAQGDMLASQVPTSMGNMVLTPFSSQAGRRESTRPSQSTLMMLI